MKLSTLRLITSNYKNSKDFILEFFDSVTLLEEEKNFSVYKLADLNIELIKEDEKNPVSNGGTIVYFNVDKFEQTLQKAISLGAKIYRGPIKVSQNKTIITQILCPGDFVIGLEANYRLVSSCTKL